MVYANRKQAKKRKTLKLYRQQYSFLAFLATAILVSTFGNAPGQRMVGTEQSTSKLMNFLCLHTTMAIRKALLEMFPVLFKYQSISGNCSGEC